MRGTIDDLTLCLVVPLFNEEERAVESVDRLLDFISARPVGSQLIFVDDGSTDRTVEVLTAAIGRRGNAAATILRCQHAGKGAAVRSGLGEATTDLAAFCDVDLATPLDQLARVIDLAALRSCLAIGSRASKQATVERRESHRREWAGKAFNRLVRGGLCGGLTDTQCGAKAAPTAAWQAILPHCRETGFAWDVEAIALALRLAIPVRELGITWIHDERTSVRVLRDGLAMVRAVPRITSNVRPVRSRPLWAFVPDDASSRILDSAPAE